MVDLRFLSYTSGSRTTWPNLSLNAFILILLWLIRPFALVLDGEGHLYPSQTRA